MTDEQEARIMAKIDAATQKLMDALAGGGSTRAPAPAASSSGACFPNYGRSKNQPVAGATSEDLRYYAAGCRRTLDDPGKSRWHNRERSIPGGGPT